MIESFYIQSSYEIGNTTKPAYSVMQLCLFFPHGQYKQLGSLTSRFQAFSPRAQLLMVMLRRFFCHGNGVEDLRRGGRGGGTSHLPERRQEEWQDNDERQEMSLPGHVS